jgi:hypothetical protein
MDKGLKNKSGMPLGASLAGTRPYARYEWTSNWNNVGKVSWDWSC